MEPAEDVPGGGKPGAWDEFKTEGLRNTAIGILAEYAEALSNAHAGGKKAQGAAEAAQAYNGAYDRIQRWGHRHVRNRWYEGDRQEGYKPESIIVAHNYAGQATVRVSAVVGLNVINGQVWLALKNLMMAEQAGAPLVIHPVPDVTPEEEKMGKTAADVIKKHFPPVFEGGVEVTRRWRPGHDTVVRAPLLNFNLQQAWVRGATSSIPGTVALASDALATAGDFGDVMVAYGIVRKRAEAKGLRTKYSDLYTNEIPAAGLANCAAWGAAIAFEDLATDMPYMGVLTGVHATSLPWERKKVTTRVGKIGRGTKLTRHLLHAMLPVYNSRGQSPPPLAGASGEEPADPTDYQVFKRQLNDPAETVYFDPVFECGPPVPHRRDPVTQRRLMELKTATVMHRLATAVRGDRVGGDVSLEQGEALRLLIATRNAWLQESVQAAVRNTLEGVYKIDVAVASSRLGTMAVPLFTDYVFDPFENEMEELGVEIQPAIGPGTMVPGAPGAPREEEPVPVFELRPDVAPPSIVDLMRMLLPDVPGVPPGEVGPPPGPGVIPALPAPAPRVVPAPAPPVLPPVPGRPPRRLPAPAIPVPIPTPGVRPAVLPSVPRRPLAPAVPVPAPLPVPVPVRPVPIPLPIPAPDVLPAVPRRRPRRRRLLVPEEPEVPPIVVIPPRIRVRGATRRTVGYAPPDPTTVGSIYGSLMRNMASGNIRTMGRSPKAGAVSINVVGGRAWQIQPPLPVRLGTFEIRTLGALDTGRGLVLGWALQGTHKGKRVKRVGGRPVALQAAPGGVGLGAFSLPRAGTLAAVVSRLAPGGFRVGHYDVRTDAAGRASGWITDVADGAVVGVIGGVTDPQDADSFRVRFLFFDADRILLPRI